VSALALGTLTFGNETDQATSFSQLDRFTEAGGTLVDSADVYADGRSEEIIGRWLAARPGSRELVVLATKGRFPTDESPNGHGLSRRHLSLALEASLRRLNVQTIDLYQVHGWDPLTRLEETLRFLDDAVRAGKINYVGLSNFTGWQLQKAVDIAQFRGLSTPVSMQPQYNLLARAVEWEIVPACQAAGLGMLAWSPLASGWLTGKYWRGERFLISAQLGRRLPALGATPRLDNLHRTSRYRRRCALPNGIGSVTLCADWASELVEQKVAAASARRCGCCCLTATREHGRCRECADGLRGGAQPRPSPAGPLRDRRWRNPTRVRRRLDQHTTGGRMIPCPVSSSPALLTGSAAPPPGSSWVKAMTWSCTPAPSSGRRRLATSPRTPRV